MISVLRRLDRRAVCLIRGHKLLAHAEERIESVRPYFEHIAQDPLGTHTVEQRANARSYLRMLNGDDPADASKDPFAA